MAVVIREAYEKKYCTKPIVCRIKGTKSKSANEIIRNIPTDNIVCIEDFNEAALTVIEMGKKAREQKLKNKTD